MPVLVMKFGGTSVADLSRIENAAKKVQAEVDAVVVALKSRTLPPHEAVAQSLEALRWLQAQQVEQVYFKYCSTFDSWYRGDVRGNIGPVTEALMTALGCSLTIATPAFPDNQRTVFNGHLFVGDVLLSESGMKDHPLTPMNDANLVRVMQAQCQRPVGLVDYRVVAQGADAIRARLDLLRAQGVAVAVVDVNDLGRVKVLASSPGCDEALLQRALRPNPAGNANERTPLVLVRPS